jgi:polyisoprenoid-binding protein YceI
MKKLTTLAAFLLVLVSAGFAQATKWTVDKGHSNVKFTVQHMVVSEMEGSFKTFDGYVESSKADFSDAKIGFTVEIASVYTDNDFFNAEKFPQMKFESTSFKPLGNNKYELQGNLTIRDVTKPVVFQVTHGGVLNTSKGAKAGFKATTTIDRFNYNLKWDRATETGGLVVGKDVTIVLNLELDKQVAAAPATK